MFRYCACRRRRFRFGLTAFRWNMNLWQSIWVWPYYNWIVSVFSSPLCSIHHTYGKETVGCVRWTISKTNKISSVWCFLEKLTRIISTDCCRHKEKHWNGLRVTVFQFYLDNFHAYNMQHHFVSYFTCVTVNANECTNESASTKCCVEELETKKNA